MYVYVGFVLDIVHHGRVEVLSGDGQLGRQEGCHQGGRESGVESTHVRLRAVSLEKAQHAAGARGKAGVLSILC